MAIELNTYQTTCPECGKEIKVSASGLDGLMDDIEDEVADACKDERKCVENEFNGMIDPDDLPIDARNLQDLATAIYDNPEALLLLRRVFADLPSRYSNAIDLGQFAKRGAK